VSASLGRVRVIALGNADAGDDAAALTVVEMLANDPVPAVELDIVRAGRPGVGLLDWLETELPVVLVDVIQAGDAPGTVRVFELAEAQRLADARPQSSSHAFGPAEVLRLGEALGRVLPRGYVVGIEGARFVPGSGLSEGVVAALGALRVAVGRCAYALARGAEES
jgi:hydrogenase maturation protease